jgi:outer membrane protein OmpA-like peptidoglycan-associated protein/tetratricopeptide (TPR) repeat protein
MRKSLSLLAYILFASIIVIAQENCDYTPSPKVQKLLDNSFDSKKYKTEERIAFLEKAIDDSPECLPCLKRLGEIQFRVAKRGGSFNSSRITLEKLIQFCPEYHSEPYYILGAIAYADRDYVNAEKYFEKFLRFPTDDPSKFEKDYEKNYAEVEEAMKSVKSYAAIYADQDKINYKLEKVLGVSSTEDDYLPMISPDGEVMFYTRTVIKQAKGDYTSKKIEEFSWSKRPDINSQFDKGEPLSKPFNMGTNCGGATISVDNRELIVAMKNPVKENSENIDLFSTRYEVYTKEDGQRGYRWGELINLGENINTPLGFEGQPSLSGDGKTLFFTGVRPECAKMTSGPLAGEYSHDIFYSTKLADGSWSKCKPLPGNINTAGNEKSPFMHSDSHTLYFSSDGHTGVGGYDIFYCKMKEDGTFTDPVNIGVPINTDADELGIVVTSDGEWAYFGARNFQGSKGWDVFQFQLPEKARPEKVMILKGQVSTKDGQPAQNAKVQVNYTESQQKEEIAINDDDGTYAAVVKMKRDENVTLSVEGPDLAFNSKLILKKGQELPVVTKVNMETETNEIGKPFVINDIYYSTSKADIEENSKIILDAFADYLKSNPKMEIEVSGHTDDVGDDKSNLALSTERAFEVMSYLSARGVPAKRMTYKGYGESRPVGDNSTAEGRAKNRRTEFVIKKM